VSRDLYRRATTVIVRQTARRAVRSGTLWGAIFGLYVYASAAGYAASYPSLAARRRLATSFGANAGLAALLGPARRLETVAGFTAWRTMGVLTIVGAIWGLLLATRMLRGEEDAGRWELMLSGQTTRRRAAGQAIAGMGAGLMALWTVTALSTVAAGSTSKVSFSVTASLYLATSLMAGASLALAVGLLAGQLAATRRQANSVGAATLGLAFLVRMAADSSSSLAWLRWASPLGWPEELHPFTGSSPLAWLPIALLVGGLTGGAILIAGRRDLGASALPSRDSPPSHTALLTGPAGLTARLGAGVALGWTAGLAALGLMLGLVAQSASTAISGSAEIEKAIGRLGGHRGGAAAYLGVAFLIAATLVSFAAAGQIAATRSEEAQGYVDHLLVQPVSRSRWLLARLAFAVSLVVGTSVVAGLFAWIGATTQNSGVGLGQLLQAGLNVAPPAVLVLGIGALVFGASPRIAPAVTYGVVAWSFLVEFLASVIRSNQLLIDTSIFSHIAPAPAANPNWAATAWLVGLGLAAAGAGVLGFDRRDLASA
jgi:ABC-2 type transport system permease protein